MANVRGSRETVPVDELQAHPAEIVARVRKTGRPVVLTRRGRGAAILEDIRQYERRAD